MVICAVIWDYGLESGLWTGSDEIDPQRGMGLKIRQVCERPMIMAR